MMVLAIALIGMAVGANHMYEKASVKGLGYKNVEMIISTFGSLGSYWLAINKLQLANRHSMPYGLT